MRRTDEPIRHAIVELLLSGWTPQDIAGTGSQVLVVHFAGHGGDASVSSQIVHPLTPEQLVHELSAMGSMPSLVVLNACTTDLPSLPTIQRIAKEEGLARPRGGPVGRSYRGGGKPKGLKGGGRPKGTLTSPHREEVRRLREQGMSLRAIAAAVGLRTAQAVSNLLTDGN